MHAVVKMGLYRTYYLGNELLQFANMLGAFFPMKLNILLPHHSDSQIVFFKWIHRISFTQSTIIGH